MPRPRKPNALKVIQGTNEPRRMYAEPELPAAGDLSPPASLKDPVAVEAWRSIVKNLGAARVLAAIDLMMLAHLCQLHAHVEGLWAAGGKPHDSTLTQLRMMAGEFGMTPATRSKAGALGEPKAENPFALIGKKSG